MKRFLLAASMLAIAASTAHAGDQIRVTGSGTVYPFTATVAEAFGKASGKKTPVVEATGSGPGIKVFCGGTGDENADFVDSSRRIKKDELTTCITNGAKDVVELTIGYDGIALANAKAGPALSVTKQQIFLALAKMVPDKDGKLVENPYKQWSDIDASLPKVNIVVLSHPATSGTRSSIEDLVLKPGAESIASLKDLEAKDPKAFDVEFKTLRTDGGFVEAGENDNTIVQKLEADKNSFALFGYASVALNGSKIKAAKVEGSAPSVEAVQKGEYKLSRPLFVYVKKDRLSATPDMTAFIAEYMSPKAIGDDGYLADKGLIPMPADQLKKEIAHAKALEPLKPDDLK